MHLGKLTVWFSSSPLLSSSKELSPSSPFPSGTDVLIDGGPQVRTRYSFLFLELLQDIRHVNGTKVNCTGNGTRMNFRCFNFHVISITNNFCRLSIHLVLPQKHSLTQQLKRNKCDFLFHSSVVRSAKTKEDKWKVKWWIDVKRKKSYMTVS